MANIHDVAAALMRQRAALDRPVADTFAPVSRPDPITQPVPVAQPAAQTVASALGARPTGPMPAPVPPSNYGQDVARPRARTYGGGTGTGAAGWGSPAAQAVRAMPAPVQAPAVAAPRMAAGQIGRRYGGMLSENPAAAHRKPRGF
jgi:hypothetical protein